MSDDGLSRRPEVPRLPDLLSGRDRRQWDRISEIADLVSESVREIIVFVIARHLASDWTTSLCAPVWKLKFLILLGILPR